jgi:hypothetical protein
MADQLDRERLRTLRAARAVLNLVALYLLLPILGLVVGAVVLAGWWVINQ